MLDIMECESGGHPDKHNGDATTGDDSWGLFQINRFGKLATTRPPADWLTDPEHNVAYAAKMYKGESFKPWSCAKKLGL